jgi:hypothetical protein
VPLFTDAKDELREHGHEPPYEFIAGPADESTIKTLSGFTPVAENLVIYGATQDVARLNGGGDGNGNWYIGTINDFAVRIVAGMPQYYGFAYKSYGRLSQRNPLRLRVDKGLRNLAAVAMADPRGGKPLTPINNLMLWLEFGVGVADRTAGTARYTVSATWADGTPT